MSEQREFRIVASSEVIDELRAAIASHLKTGRPPLQGIEHTWYLQDRFQKAQGLRRIDKQIKDQQDVFQGKELVSNI